MLAKGHALSRLPTRATRKENHMSGCPRAMLFDMHSFLQDPPEPETLALALLEWAYRILGARCRSFAVALRAVESQRTPCL